jgi:hypothetical protein
MPPVSLLDTVTCLAVCLCTWERVLLIIRDCCLMPPGYCPQREIRQHQRGLTAEEKKWNNRGLRVQSLPVVLMQPEPC